MAEAGEGDSEIEVAEREEMLQADGEQSLFGGFFVAALAQADDGQS